MATSRVYDGNPQGSIADTFGEVANDKSFSESLERAKT
jgi:hypothetical protein